MNDRAPHLPVGLGLHAEEPLLDRLRPGDRSPELLCRRVDRDGVRRADLAHRLGPPFALTVPGTSPNMLRADHDREEPRQRSTTCEPHEHAGEVHEPEGPVPQFTTVSYPRRLSRVTPTSGCRIPSSLPNGWPSSFYGPGWLSFPYPVGFVACPLAPSVGWLSFPTPVGLVACPLVPSVGWLSFP
jgi:hypothetical protein